MSLRILSTQLIRSICNAWQKVYDSQKLSVLRKIEQAFPVVNPALQLLPATYSPSPHQPENPLDFDGILMAVPKKRRTVERRKLRSFGWTKRMEHTIPKDNIVTCPKCGAWHESHTICGKCYEKVRQKTAEMRAKLEEDDDYFFGQNQVDVDDLLQRHEIDPKSEKIRTEKQRYAEELSWFDDNLKKRVT